MDDKDTNDTRLTTSFVSAADVETVAADIIRGRHDLNLDILARAINRRRNAIAEARVISLRVGSRVRLQGLGAGSKYLNGVEGTVTGFLTKNIKVRIDAKYDTRRFGHNLRVPPTLLRQID